MRFPGRLRYVVPAMVATAAIALVACSDSLATSGSRGVDDGSSSSSSGGPSDGAGLSPSPGGEKGDLGPTDNAVILVHAAGMPAFRMCFEKEPDLRPMPDQETMPEANVVGVEVGSAVRLAPLKGPPGKVFVFNESLIRQYAGQGLKCGDLLASTEGNSAFEMTAITTDYSKGVHLLVLRGCQGKTPLTTRTKEECGQDYDPLATGSPAAAKGNLSLLDIELKGAYRTVPSLPTQVIHLSQALESSRNGATLAVTFGDVTTETSFHASAAENPTLFANEPEDLGPSAPTFETDDESVYANVGFRVVTKSGNTTTVVAQQSLAETQKLSAPRDIPSSYYSAASNYVLLLLGSPAEAAQPDGGDPRKGVHLLAVPVVDPTKFDGGSADGGPTTTDAGAGDGGT